MNIANADPSSAVHLGESFRRDSHTVVGNFDRETAIELVRADVNLASLKARAKPVFDGIFDHGLEQHTGNEGIERLGIDLLKDLQLVTAEADHLDIQVVIDEFQLIAQGDERFVFTQKATKDVR